MTSRPAVWLSRMWLAVAAAAAHLRGMARPALSTLAETVRRHDPDRFFTALFAPPERRETLLLLYAFNHELARARAVVSEPMMALIRLQWWREVVEGARRAHEVATPLTAALAAGALARDDLLAMIAAREVEADAEIPTLAAFRAYVGGSAGTLAVAAARVLARQDVRGMPPPAVLHGVGAAYGIAQVLRGIAVLARRGRCLLPADVLAAHGLTPQAVIAAPAAPKLGAVRRVLALEGLGLLETPPSLPRAAIAAGLVGTLARRDLRRGGELVPRRLGDRLAVIAAVLRGRP